MKTISFQARLCGNDQCMANCMRTSWKTHQSLKAKMYASLWCLTQTWNTARPQGDQPWVQSYGPRDHCWHFSCCQSTVETARYASEFIAGCAALDELIAVRYELRMLGVPLDGPIWMFGDNKSMIGSLAELAGQLTKRHLIVSWHQLQEKAAMGVVFRSHRKKTWLIV
jgi:hypothetical protein